MSSAKEPDKNELPPPPPYEEVCTMPGHQSLSPPQLYDLNSYASPSDAIITPHTYPPPASLMHGSCQSPQSFTHGYESQLHAYTPHDMQVLSRNSNRPVAMMTARVPMDGQRRRIYMKIFTMVTMIIIIVFVIAITQWFH
ncbi:uncharacterized protein LOC125645497 [Ostrea edulis]|uniref:uncharacterized protein LOC125645497 n=1 Tax=Ostrea edulis TaxID=37623 RepID=UPI002095530D|nr:uncharacterized protein LOC125645497 [Ostrea edulis]